MDATGQAAINLPMVNALKTLQEYDSRFMPNSRAAYVKLLYYVIQRYLTTLFRDALGP